MTNAQPPRLLVKTLAVIFLTVALLLGAVFVVVTVSVRDQVRQSVAANLESGQRIYAAVENRRQRELQTQAATLAENPTLKATIDTYAAEAHTADPARLALWLTTIGNELDKVAARVDSDALILGDTHQITLAAARTAIVSDGLVTATTLPATAAREFEAASASRQPAGTVTLDRESYAFRRLVQGGSTSFYALGSIGVPDAVLMKPGALTDAEFDIIEQHPVAGARILRSVPFLVPHIPIVELHHERPDGRGYPHGLRGDEIPMPARIVHVADAYDAITSKRAYRGARPFGDALREIWRFAGTEFHAEVVAALATALPGVTTGTGELVVEPAHA